MLPVPIQRAVVGAQVERIEQHSIGASIAERLTPGIRPEEADAMRKTLAETDLQGIVIVGQAVVIGQRACSTAYVRKRQARYPRTRQRGIEFGNRRQVAAERSHVTQRQHSSIVEVAL